MSSRVAAQVGGLLGALLGDPLPVRFEFWDGSGVGPAGGAALIRVRSADALRRVVWSPDQLGVARAFVAGDLEVEGDSFVAFRALRASVGASHRIRWRAMPAGVASAKRLGAFGRPLPPPPEEIRVRGQRHSLRRDAQAVRHHYDVGNEFYRIVLGPALTYSCARYSEDGMSLADAQAAKHELVCRKLGLHRRPGARLLDVGCGWGSLVLHAATHHGASAVGITISPAQADAARRRAEEAGLAGQVEIRVQDYRELGGETFDAVSSVGMSEHVGSANLARYFATLRTVLGPGGRILNHAISAPGGSRLGGDRSFMGRYVFPDGELIDAATVAGTMEQAGFELRDVESLREHYAKTLRAWVANLEADWDEAVRLVGAARARVWRLYMVASALGFEAGRIAIHQVLGVVAGDDGASAMPATRRSWG